MTLRGSVGDGAAWAGPSAYSDLAGSPDGRILCLDGGGEQDPYDFLRLAFVELDSTR